MIDVEIIKVYAGQILSFRQVIANKIFTIGRLVGTYAEDHVILHTSS